MDDGNFFYEVEGLPEVDSDEDMFPLAKQPSKVKFSTSPMKVCMFERTAKAIDLSTLNTVSK